MLGLITNSLVISRIARPRRSAAHPAMLAARINAAAAHRTARPRRIAGPLRWIAGMGRTPAIW